MISFTPYLMWDENRRIDIQAQQDLDLVIDQLLMQTHRDIPLSVQLSVNLDSSLLITVGGEESHVEFYSKSAPTLVVGCRGPWNDDSLVAFTHGGEYSEIERRYCVPFAQARAALHQYFQTGQRPDNIEWNDELNP